MVSKQNLPKIIDNLESTGCLIDLVFLYLLVFQLGVTTEPRTQVLAKKKVMRYIKFLAQYLAHSS